MGRRYRGSTGRGVYRTSPHYIRTQRSHPTHHHLPPKLKAKQPGLGSGEGRWPPGANRTQKPPILAEIQLLSRQSFTKKGTTQQGFSSLAARGNQSHRAQSSAETPCSCSRGTISPDTVPGWADRRPGRDVDHMIAGKVGQSGCFAVRGGMKGAPPLRGDRRSPGLKP